jgi:hypothetical protein
LRKRWAATLGRTPLPSDRAGQPPRQVQGTPRRSQVGKKATTVCAAKTDFDLVACIGVETEMTALFTLIAASAVFGPVVFVVVSEVAQMLS